MKKLLFIALILSLFQVSNAQETEVKNKIILGGAVNFMTQNNAYPSSSLGLIGSIGGGYYSSTTNDSKYTSFSVAPYLGKEINNHLTIGLQLGYLYNKYTEDDVLVFNQANLVNLKRNTNQISIGLFSRHFMNPEKRVVFYIQPYIQYSLYTRKSYEDAVETQEEKVNNIELGVGLGGLYKINDRMRVTLRTGGLSYINGKFKNVTEDTNKNFSSFRANFNLSGIYIGFELTL